MVCDIDCNNLPYRMESNERKYKNAEIRDFAKEIYINKTAAAFLCKCSI